MEGYCSLRTKSEMRINAIKGLWRMCNNLHIRWFLGYEVFHHYLLLTALPYLLHLAPLTIKQNRGKERKTLCVHNVLVRAPVLRVLAVSFLDWGLQWMSQALLGNAVLVGIWWENDCTCPFHAILNHAAEILLLNKLRKTIMTQF
jgi:hypothetical protein